MHSPIPSPPRNPIIGNLLQIRGPNPIQKLIALSEQYGPIFELRIFNNRLIVASGQEIVDEISTNKFYKKVSGPIEKLRTLAGDGLFTAHTHEPNWEKAHNILLPGFGLGAMKGYFPVMLQVSHQLIEKWDKAADTQEPLLVVDDMTRLTLDTIGLAGFDYDFASFHREDLHPFIQYMNTCLEETKRIMYRLPVMNTLDFQSKKKLKTNVQALNKIVDDVIAERRKHPRPDTNDFLNLMLDGVDKNSGEKLSDENIRFQIITFLIAGHETTSGLLSFAIHYLLKHPEVLRKATNEVDEVFGRDLGKVPEYRTISSLKYLNQILKETMRLWPPAPGFRVAPNEDVIVAAKYRIARDQPILILAPSLHRDVKVWGDNANLFDPENFSPENEAGRPDNHYKPFGTGVRACIGRQFAMVEAQLVLAMVLQRFRLIDHENYQLRIKETLTIKPDDFIIKVKRREGAPVASPVNARQPAISHEDESFGHNHHDTSMLILYGSNMGLSQGLANELMNSAIQRGFRAEVSSMDDWHKPLNSCRVLVAICSTYNGAPPDNAKKFFHRIHNGATAMSGTRFAVFGCGNSDWKTFQIVPRAITKRFLELGGEQVLDSGEGNVNEDFESQYENWIGSFWVRLSEQLALGTYSQVESENTISVVILDEAAGETPVRPNCVTMSVLSNRELQNADLSGRSTRHIEVALPESARYLPGDHLAIYPGNPTALVQRVLQRFHLDGDTVVKLVKENEFTTTLPVGQNIRISDLLTHHVELQEVCTRRNLKTLLKVTLCPPEKERIQQLNSDDASVFNEYVHGARRSVLDLLEEFPASEITFGQFLLMLPPLRPRYYSISSSPSIGKDVCSVTVSVVDVPARVGKGTYKGVCSNYLSLAREGQSLFGFVQDAGTAFRLPEDSRIPLIMIGPGTGFAPMRGFLQERLHQKRAGRPLGKALLFFGARNRDHDFIYREEAEEFEREGVVQVITAFSRPDSGEHKAYVQDRILEHRDAVLEILGTQGRIYICGDGSRMEPDVRRTFDHLLRESKLNINGVDQLIDEGRYSMDVWSAL
jgi:cytochrome P450 / NADPH-cytochrome P450 reductase